MKIRTNNLTIEQVQAGDFTELKVFNTKTENIIESITIDRGKEMTAKELINLITEIDLENPSNMKEWLNR